MDRPRGGTNINHTKEAVYFFNYIKPVRKLKRKPPVKYRFEQAA